MDDEAQQVDEPSFEPTDLELPFIARETADYSVAQVDARFRADHDTQLLEFLVGSNGVQDVAEPERRVGPGDLDVAVARETRDDDAGTCESRHARERQSFEVGIAHLEIPGRRPG